MTPSFIGHIYIRSYMYRGGDRDIHVSQLLIGSHHTVCSITWAWVEVGEAHVAVEAGAEAAWLRWRTLSGHRGCLPDGHPDGFPDGLPDGLPNGLLAVSDCPVAWEAAWVSLWSLEAEKVGHQLPAWLIL